MGGALFGYAIESELPLARLREAPAPRGTLRLARADGELLALDGELVGWHEVADPPWRTAFVRTAAGLLADCSITGTYLVEPRARRVRAAPRQTGPSWQHVMVATAFPLLLSELGDLVLHASAVVVDGRAVAFCGLAGRGKSTLAYGLARPGRPLLAEDGLALSRAGDSNKNGGWLAWPGPRGVRLLGDGEPGKRVRYVDAAAEHGEPVALGAVVALAERAPGPPSVERLAPANAVQALLGNAIYAPGGGLRRAFAGATQLAASAPVFRARLPDDLDAVAHAGERLLEQVSVG
jgi:hypothetical protein